MINLSKQLYLQVFINANNLHSYDIKYFYLIIIIYTLYDTKFGLVLKHINHLALNNLKVI